MKRSIVHFAMLAMVPAAFNLSGPASGGTITTKRISLFTWLRMTARITVCTASMP